MSAPVRLSGGVRRLRLIVVKVVVSVAAGIVSAASLIFAPPAFAAGDGAVSPAEFRRYERGQALELEREQALHADANAPESPEAARRQRRQFEAERIRQRSLLERQRRSVLVEQFRSRSSPRPGASRGLMHQRLRIEQGSEEFSRKVLR